MNATKITTVIHFLPEKEKYKSNLNNGEKPRNYENFSELIEFYNNVSSFAMLDFNTFFNVYIPIKFYDFLKDYCVVDCIGKTKDNNEDYNSVMVKIKFNYPNNINLFITKELTTEICNKYENIILTHADLINYETDKTKKVKHLEHLDKFKKNAICYVSNISENVRTIKLGDYDNIVYTKASSLQLMSIIYHKLFPKIEIYDILKFNTMMFNNRFSSKVELLNICYKFNIYKIYHDFNNNGYSLKYMVDNLHKYKNKENDAKINYIEFSKSNKIGKKCENFLKTYVLNFFGDEYIDYELHNVKEIYEKLETKKYIDMIAKLNNSVTDVNTESRKRQRE
jgi:hypothetical protein